MTSSLVDLLLGRPPEGADPVLVHMNGAETSRAEVATAALLLGRRLREAGIEAGAVVASVVPTSADAVAAMFGVWAAGCAFTPLNPRAPEAERDRLLQQVGVAAVVEDGLGVRPLKGERHVDADVALVLFTSGTTGRPKPVQLRHSGTLAALDAVLRSIGASRPADRAGEGEAAAPPRPRMPNLIPFPLSLWSGIYNVCFALRVGSAVVLMERFDPLEFAELVRRFGIRSCVLSPAMLAVLLEDERVGDLAPLRLVRNATAPLSVGQARRFHERFGIAVLNGYGQTELGGEVVGWNAADIRKFSAEKLGAVGRAHPGIELRIAGDDGRPLPEGEVGEVCVRSPYAMAGYLDGADGAEGARRLTDDGLVRTGDLGWIDADGFLWLSGRVSDVINRGGLKVYPDEVEDALRDHPAVRDVAVAGVPDERLGEVPWAFVVPASPDAPFPKEEVEDHCRASMAAFKIPVRFFLVADLPRNDAGKVMRLALVEQAQHI